MALLSLIQDIIADCVKMYNSIVILILQSAIGEGMTRRDHSDVSNQVQLKKNSTKLKYSDFPLVITEQKQQQT